MPGQIHFKKSKSGYLIYSISNLMPKIKNTQQHISTKPLSILFTVLKRLSTIKIKAQISTLSFQNLKIQVKYSHKKNFRFTFEYKWNK
jgi:ribulose bisphosphate carboxylase small subunit